MRKQLHSFLLLLFLFPASSLSAEPLLIATSEVPPFAMQQVDGTWDGLSIRLWQAIANKLDLEYQFVPMSLAEMLVQLETGQVDAAVGAITVTEERELLFDFSHPFHTTGLTIAVPHHLKNSWLSALRGLSSSRFWIPMSILIVLLLGTGILIWWLEHRHNPQFPTQPQQGIEMGIWWSAVTMTTVGYGDKVPLTRAGRFLGIIWMYLGIVLVSSFTATITASLTISELGSQIKGPEDLHSAYLATVAESTSEAYLQAHRHFFRSYPNALAGLQAVANGQVDAMVYDAPVLQYLAKTQLPGEIDVMLRTFSRQDYAIALPQNSPLREPLNQALLHQIRDPKWQEVLFQYLGQN